MLLFKFEGFFLQQWLVDFLAGQYWISIGDGDSSEMFVWKEELLYLCDYKIMKLERQVLVSEINSTKLMEREYFNYLESSVQVSLLP